jgi:hypothetical protein
MKPTDKDDLLAACGILKILFPARALDRPERDNLLIRPIG